MLVAGVAVGWLLRGDDPESQTFEAESLAQIGPEMEATLEVQGEKGTLHVVQAAGLGIGRGLPGVDPARWRHGGVQHLRRPQDGEVEIEGSLEGAEGVYITREPEGGSEAPTERPIMGVELS